jgi:hypothetical protein
MSRVTPILVLLVATVALAQAPAQPGPKRLGRPVLGSDAGTTPTVAPARPETSAGVGAAKQPAPTAPGTVVPKRLGRPVLVPPVAPAGTPAQRPQRR